MPSDERELNYKKILIEYHRSLMEISRALTRAGNEQPGQKDQAAQNAGMDFWTVVEEFHSKYGRLLI